MAGLVKILAGGELAIWGAVSGFGQNGIITTGNGGGSVENFGTLVVQGATSQATISVGLTNETGGMIDVQSGTLDLTGGGSSAGTLQTESGATLEIGGGTFTADSGSTVDVSGTLDVANGGTFVLDTAGTVTTLIDSGSTVDSNAALSVSSLTLATNSTTLSETATVTVSTSFAWSGIGSTISGTGETVISSGATGTITANVDLINELDIAGGITLGN